MVRGMELLREQLADGEIGRRKFNVEYAALLDSFNAIQKQLRHAERA